MGVKFHLQPQKVVGYAVVELFGKVFAFILKSLYVVLRRFKLAAAFHLFHCAPCFFRPTVHDHRHHCQDGYNEGYGKQNPVALEDVHA